jgi:glutathione S-transferase
MYELYIANKNYSSWSLRPWALMRALSIPFEERLVFFEPGPNWERFRKFSPTGRVPCLHDEGRVVWESLAIVEYLAERHEGVWPADAEARAWARSATSEMHASFSALRNVCSMSCGLRIALNEISPALEADIARVDELWSEGLERFGGPWLAGAAFTAVDAFYAPVVFRFQTYSLPLSEAARGYYERALAHPVIVEWYEAGIAETARDVPHEQEFTAVGCIEADYRASA